MIKLTHILHPMTIVRGRWAERRAQILILRLARSGGGEVINPASPPPNTLLWPSELVVRSWLASRPWEDYDSMAVDIEAAGDYITILGATLYNLSGGLGPTLVLPFKKRGGLNYWEEWNQHLLASELAYELLASPTRKVFHNGISFDVPMLTAAGFKLGGTWHDTMVRAHYCYPEMKKSLQYLCTTYLGMPHWKSLLDEDDDEEGKT